METNDIKDIWKAGVEESITPYSGEELNKMVIKSARKSIQAVYPGTIFRLVVISIIIFLITGVFFINQKIELKIIDLSALVILSVSYFLWERSAYQMRKYIIGKPIKEWLEYRIEEIEKSIKFNTKYNWVLYGCSFLCAIGFYAAYQIVTNTRLSILTTIVVPLGIIIYLLIVRRSLNRNYQKALDELKDLYKEFEE